jgi:hypothetical protein
MNLNQHLAAAVALAYVKIKTTEKLPCYEEAFLAVAVRLEQNQR